MRRTGLLLHSVLFRMVGCSDGDKGFRILPQDSYVDEQDQAWQHRNGRLRG